MPLDINQLAPVALWRTEYAVEGGTRVEWTTDVPLKSIWTNSCVRHETLPAATYSALVEELREARAVIDLLIPDWLPESTGEVLQAIHDCADDFAIRLIRARSALAGKAAKS